MHWIEVKGICGEVGILYERYFVQKFHWSELPTSFFQWKSYSSFSTVSTTLPWLFCAVIAGKRRIGHGLLPLHFVRWWGPALLLMNSFGGSNIYSYKWTVAIHLWLFQKVCFPFLSFVTSFYSNTSFKRRDEADVKLGQLSLSESFLRSFELWV